jgi:T6SS immunity protein Tdi1, C-terminal
VNGVRQDLIIPLVGIDTELMLESWRWLIPSTHRPLFATALGDLFLTDPEGQILWLDMGDGQLQQVAASEAEFVRAAADPDNSSVWFGAVLVDELRAAGKVLGPGECYCYLLLPMLGGEYEPGNFRIYDVVTHFQVWGPIHEQLRDVPNGATIEFEIINAPPRTQDAEPDAAADPRRQSGSAG